MSLLGIIPGSKDKIWQVNLSCKAVPALAAYIGKLHQLSQRFAAFVCDRWVILSAKYGFLRPHDFVENYDFDFGHPEAIEQAALRQQVKILKLYVHDSIVVFGEDQHVESVRTAFVATEAMIYDPLKGMQFPEQFVALQDAIDGLRHYTKLLWSR